MLYLSLRGVALSISKHRHYLCASVLADCTASGLSGQRLEEGDLPLPFSQPSRRGRKEGEGKPALIAGGSPGTQRAELCRVCNRCYEIPHEGAWIKGGSAYSREERRVEVAAGLMLILPVTVLLSNPCMDYIILYRKPLACNP